MEIVKGFFSVLAMIGCLSAIALGFISPKYALAYSFASLFFFAIAIALSLEIDFHGDRKQE